MKFETYDVISLVTIGGEFVGKFIEETDTHVVISDPRMFAQMENQSGFIPAISMTGEQKPDRGEFNKTAIITIVPTAREIEKNYRQATSGIVL